MVIIIATDINRQKSTIEIPNASIQSHAVQDFITGLLKEGFSHIEVT
jgi:hypothetical protein